MYFSLTNENNFNPAYLYHGLVLKILAYALCEKRLNTEVFPVRIFMYSDWIRSPNTGKYGPEKTLYLDTFHAVMRWFATS